MAEEARPDRLVVRRVMPATRQEVFAAWTNPESIRDWMCPGDTLTAEAELDLRVGGAYRIVMRSESRAYEHTGEYRVVEPPSKLVFTWMSKGTEYRSTLVTVELLDRGDQCELVLTHEHLPTPDAMKGHQGGWSQIAERLAAHLQKRAPARPRG